MNGVPSTPYYILYEDKLRENLKLINKVSSESGVEIILAFKAFALWKTFDIFKEYICSTTASSPFEAKLANDYFGSLAHTYSPAYEENTFNTILECSKCITFNSLSQYSRFYDKIKDWNSNPANHNISAGIRINPERSEIATDIYNPCAPGTRFGISASDMPANLPDGIEGFHCHCHCENDSYALERTLDTIESKFGKWLGNIKWLNLGGGHLMTRKGYDINHLVKILRDFRHRHPNLEIIMEPGSAFAWQTGDLIASVVDIVEDKGIKTAILNVSFTCHMPDCLEMPYQPEVEGALSLGNEIKNITDENIFRLGGNSCLSGDFMGYWLFPNGLNVGDEIIFKDMIHYTTVKTTMFNGIQHPSICMKRHNGNIQMLREYKFEDYRDMMD
ncbi:MAG: carboxynorspermidine decarboxylase [Bacteroidaceae bacterium]|nr:carboxynorspermidine decarboxylase [Prevotellaceae bacterium]MDY4759197.1 carboxynorspermidine decarboxylase [Bacteroidaceae bacterium]